MRFQRFLPDRSMVGFSLGLSLFFSIGCSGPSTVTTTPADDPAELESPFRTGSFVWVGEDGATFVDLAAGDRHPLGGGSRLVFSSVAPDGDYAAFATADTDSSWLTLISKATGNSVGLHSGAPDLTFSAAWSPDGRQLAFGYYEPAIANDRPAQGAGDIKIVTSADGVIQRLGCSLSKEVILWSNPDQLVVRATDDMYRVSREGCRTIQEVDVRRWHHITSAPVGSRIAYIYRELSFNRETRAYEPDSALYVAGTAGAGGIKVVGDRYQPRNMAWSPDATELAFDVLVEPGGTERAVAVYNIESTETMYVSPPTEGGPSQTRPVWNPSGSGLSFLLNGRELLVQPEGSMNRIAVIVGGNSITEFSGWLTDTTLLVKDEVGNTWLYDLITNHSELVGPGTALAF